MSIRNCTIRTSSLNLVQPLASGGTAPRSLPHDTKYLHIFLASGIEEPVTAELRKSGNLEITRFDYISCLLWSVKTYNKSAGFWGVQPPDPCYNYLLITIVKNRGKEIALNRNGIVQLHLRGSEGQKSQNFRLRHAEFPAWKPVSEAPSPLLKILAEQWTPRRKMSHCGLWHTDIMELSQL